MRSKLLVCLLLVSFVLGTSRATSRPHGSAAKPGGSQTRAPQAPEVKVGPDDTVITLKGFCADSSLARRCLQDVDHAARNLKSLLKRCSQKCLRPFAVSWQRLLPDVQNVDGSGETRPRQAAQVRRNDAPLRACRFFLRN